jgi:hypothetical protein
MGPKRPRRASQAFWRSLFSKTKEAFDGGLLPPACA